MKKTKKLTPNQGMIIFGVFLTIGGLTSLILNYVNSDEISSFVTSVFLTLMGLIMIFLGKRTEI